MRRGHRSRPQVRRKPYRAPSSGTSPRERVVASKANEPSPFACSSRTRQAACLARVSVAATARTPTSTPTDGMARTVSGTAVLPDRPFAILTSVAATGSFFNSLDWTLTASSARIKTSSLASQSHGMNTTSSSIEVPDRWPHRVEYRRAPAKSRYASARNGTSLSRRTPRRHSSCSGPEIPPVRTTFGVHPTLATVTGVRERSPTGRTSRL